MCGGGGRVSFSPKLMGASAYVHGVFHESIMIVIIIVSDCFGILTLT